MTPEQAAAFIQSQTACAMAEIEAMKSENRMRQIQDHSPAYDEGAFRAVPDAFGIGHNSVVEMFREANSY
jgi:hypothetical protein